MVPESEFNELVHQNHALRRHLEKPGLGYRIAITEGKEPGPPGRHDMTTTDMTNDENTDEQLVVAHASWRRAVAAKLPLANNMHMMT